MSREVNRLRERVRQIDGKILQLTKERLDLVRRIGERKRLLGLPVTDLAVEREVMERAIAVSNAIGLDERVARELVGLLIWESVRVQGGATLNRASSLYDIFEGAEELEAKGERVIRLDAGEPDFLIPSKTLKVAKRAIDDRALSGYVSSWGLPELREALAEKLTLEFGVDLKPENILITPGGKFAVFAAILAYISTGDRALIVEPSWPVYAACVEIARGRADIAHTTLEDNWRIDLDTVDTALATGAKLLILNSPCNPTGKIIEEGTLREMAGMAEKRGAYILSDEVYHAYAFKPHKSILQVANSNFIYADSFSKEFGMTGWRIGYAVSDPQTIEKMHKILQMSVTCLPGFIQKTALEALKSGSDSKANPFRKIMEGRINVACRELDRLPVSYMRPEGAMYIFPKVNREGFDSKVFANSLLREAKVAVAPGEAFGRYPEHLRLSMTASKPDVKEAIRRINAHLKL